MGRSKKIWNSKSIRELARSRFDEVKEQQQKEAEANKGASGKSLADFLFGPQSKFAQNQIDQETVEEPFNLDAVVSQGPEITTSTLGDLSAQDKVILIVPGMVDDMGEEISLLCETLGFVVAETVFLPPRKRVDSATFVGKGLAESLVDRIKFHSCRGLVVDAPLSPTQVKNLEKLTGIAVTDRHGVILEIFKHHAQTRLAKLQVEIAQLKYLQSRLSGQWMGLSRQRGAKGGLGGRGLGESRLELDRRVVKDRIAKLSHKLKDAEKIFSVQSARRSMLPRVALVGYTNAGKSTLMRRLTNADVQVENKLFSTLDTTVRVMVPPTSPRILVSDTVGFIKHLPHDLVASFKSTLQEAIESHLILQVVDVSHPRWIEQLETTEEVLEEIGSGSVEKILVLNKEDRVSAIRRRGMQIQMMKRSSYKAIIWTSGLTGAGVGALKEAIMGQFKAKLPDWLKKQDFNPEDTEDGEHE